MAAQSNGTSNDYDALIIGAGFSGLYLLDQLREQGFSVRLIEAGTGLGGIWHWNCYPGARVDSPCSIYQFSNERIWRNWNWSELYPGWKEMRAYFEFVDQTLDLSKDIDFGTWVRGGHFDEERHQWELRTEGPEGAGTIRGRFLLACTGFAAKPYVPDIPGLDSFAGISHHTGLWPQEGVDFHGKRVGVLGTGASGVQVIQEAGREAAHLTVFQRTPNLCLPMEQRQLDAAKNDEIREHCARSFELRAGSFAGFDYSPIEENARSASESERQAFYEALWAEGGFKFWLGNYNDMLLDDDANDLAYAFWRDKVRERINDPELAEVMAPTEAPHPFGVKRPCLEQWYYDLFNEDHVDLVNLKKNPIERVTPTGVVVEGQEIPLDVLVVATGFDAVTGGLTQIDLRGGDGRNLAEKWKDGVRTYQGMAISGYPNLMFCYGPQAPTAFCNGPSSAEYQGDFIVACLRHMREQGHTRIEPTPEAEDAWRNEILEVAETTLFPKAQSWYMGANIPGKKRELLMYAGGLPAYLEILEASVAKGYEGYRLG